MKLSSANNDRADSFRRKQGTHHPCNRHYRCHCARTVKKPQGPKPICHEDNHQDNEQDSYKLCHDRGCYNDFRATQLLVSRVSLMRSAVVKRVLRPFFASLNLFLSPPGAPMRTRSSALLLEQSFFRRQSRSCPPYSLRPVSLASFGAAYQPSLRSGWSRGRDASCLAPPAQSRTGRFPACGSYRRYVASKRM